MRPQKFYQKLNIDSSVLINKNFSAGSSVGLTTILAVMESDVDYVCRGPVQGFKVILHSPNELPDVNGQHFRLPFDESVRMSVKPNVLVTSKSLENYSPERYNPFRCFFC